MNRPNDKPRLIARRGDEIVLSGSALAGLLKAVLDKKKPFRFRSKGLSMLPFIHEGDKVTVVVPVRHLNIGDIVAFTNPESGRMAIHRIIGKKKDGYILKGDNLKKRDGLITGDNILGVVQLIERNDRQVVMSRNLAKRMIALLSRLNCFYYIHRLRTVFKKSIAVKAEKNETQRKKDSPV